MSQNEEHYDYSLKSYSDTLVRYREDGYAVTGFGQYLAEPTAKHLILRHDIDNSIEQAHRVAKIDAEADCTSTFFMRVHARGYNLLSLPSLLILREIESMGHEVQLHLEGGFCEWLGDDNFYWAERQREVFEAAVGRPLGGFSSHEPARMGGIEFANELLSRWQEDVKYHAYEERFMMPNMKYLSDSSGRWREGHFGMWVGKEPLMQVLTHPFWWFDKVPAENY
ncbi:GCN5 family acetyltransferase [Leucobacter sp. UT-8R-CII-1-4]|uniref:GCN5 family acetyltransferase n=1 Tax=Leucobacter sp. UT-8R-CII-1-4 TaxID=3040075 RepID=UPI0024A8EE3E|nr:GCN5 family acetyltransferase [Leucobacter sp. UT-8R-CII-1-4]MDI6023760.1 GCN5 family acetyltransferase [Leucobacter sp. UT-8R-CII-1-4]